MSAEPTKRGLVEESKHEYVHHDVGHHTPPEKYDPQHMERRHSRGVEAINMNTSAKIQNPLFGIPKDVLFSDVDQFCRENGFEEEVPLFRKAALVGQNPHRFESYEELDEEDKNWLRREKTHKWSQPPALIFTVVLASVGAAVQGWDQTGSNGANLSFPVEFGIPDSEGSPNAYNNSWLVGLVNAGPYIGSALLGCWLNDPVNNYLGRRGTIFISAIFCLLTPIGSALTQNWYQLLICRLLMGIGMGLKASTVPIFNAENVPASVRGGLVMSWQLWTAFGIFLGFSANLAVMDTGRIAWRLQLGSAFIPAVPLVLGIYFCPESPRWLMKKGRFQEAFKSLLRLRNSRLQAARDLYYVYCQLIEEQAALGNSSYIKRFIELFTIPRVRRATMASFVVMLAQQMCGINIIAFYSSSVFADAGYDPKQCLLASWGFGLLNFVFAIPAVFTIDTFGRRNLLLSTFPNMAWTLLVTGLMFLLPGPVKGEDGTIISKGSGARLPLIALFIYLFAICYSVGEGPVPFAYSAEVFPITHREVGMGWAVATCLFWAAILGLTWPAMKTVMTPTGAFGFYAGLNVTAFVMIFFLLPETKQLTLEELDYVFGVPMSKHASYQVGTWLPWWIKRHILRKKDAKLTPLYNLDEIGGIEKDPEFAALTAGAAH